MNATASTPELAAALREHFVRIILPIWRGPGFNSALGLPYEAVAADGRTPLPVTRYRAMACARQLFVFALSGEMQHAQRLFESLTHIFEDRTHGGWFAGDYP